MGAAAALLASLAFAHPPHGGGFGGRPGPGPGSGWHGEARAAQPRFGGANRGMNGGGPRWGLRPMSTPTYGTPYSGHPQYAGTPQYGGGQYGRYPGNSPYRSISANSGGMQRPGQSDGAVRSGSIRADVARYNEERGGGRPQPQPRMQDNGGGRSTFFSSFYRNN